MRWHRRPTSPVPPEGVRLVLRDGREIICDVLYDGLDDQGIHRWFVVPSIHVERGQVASIQAARLPGHTGLVFAP